jgi:iron(III) transport system substrate-binding protein
MAANAPLEWESRSMIASRLSILALSLGGIFLSAGLQAAAPTTVDDVANYSGADRQAVLEAGAKKEAAVQVYSTGTQNQPLLDAFSKKYPYIKLGFFRNDGSTIAKRWIEEYKAGQYLADVFDGGSTALPIMRDNDVIGTFKSPEMAAFRKEGIEQGPKGPLWANDYESYLSLGYNTKLVSEAEVPRTYDDLLNPKWQGKMAIAGSNTLGNWVGAAVLDKGEDYVRKLGAQKVKIFNVSGRAVANLVVSGEVYMSPASFDSHFANSKDEGASVDWLALGGVYSTTGAVAIAKRAPHPNAAMLYIDFMISKLGQEMYKKIGYGSAREDLPAKSKPSKIYYLAQRPNYAEEYEKWNQLGRQVFGNGESIPGVK